MILSEIQKVIKKSHLGCNLSVTELNKTGIPEWYNLLVLEISNKDTTFIRDAYLLLSASTNFLKIKQQFMITVLKENANYYDFKKFKDVYNSTQDIIELWELDPERKNEKKWSVANSAAYSAANSAANSAAYSAANSAAYSAANSAAYSAAYSAANSAAYSAAYSAANSAAYSAANSAAYSAAWEEVRSKRRVELQHILLEIVKGS